MENGVTPPLGVPALFEPAEFAQRLEIALREEGLTVSSLEASPYSGGGVHGKIDGDACISNIDIWPNGLFDVEYISLPAEERTYVQREILSAEEAFVAFLQEVRRAVERAKNKNGG